MAGSERRRRSLGGGKDEGGQEAQEGVLYALREGEETKGGERVCGAGG